MKKYICILMAALIVLGSVSVVFAAPSLQAGVDDEIGNSFDVYFRTDEGAWLTWTFYKKDFKSNAAYIQAASLAGSKSYTGTNYLGEWGPVLVAAIREDEYMYLFAKGLTCYTIGMTPQQWRDAEAGGKREDNGLGEKPGDSSEPKDMVEYNKYVNSLIRANELTLKGLFSDASLPSISTVPLYNSNVNLYYNSRGDYSFYEVLQAYLNTLVAQGYGSTFGYNDLMYHRYGVGSSANVYELGLIRDNISDAYTGILELIPVVSTFVESTHFVALTNDKGYSFDWYPESNSIVLSVGNSVTGGSHTVTHVVKGTGNNLAIQGSGQGLETFKYYYQDALADPVTAALQSNIYAQGVALGLYESGALSLLQKIASGSTAGGSVIVPEGLGQQFLYEGDTNTWIDQSDNSQHYGDLFYNPSTQSYVYNTQNYTYEITNNYNYTHINYYMPGTDVPFSQKDFYYQLPDGRNSMELRAEDVYGINTGFDVVLYDFVASDPYMQSLYHFDGDTYNDALPVGYVRNIVDLVDLDISHNYAGRTRIDFDFSPYLGQTLYFEFTGTVTYHLFLTSVSNNSRIYFSPGTTAFTCESQYYDWGSNWASGHMRIYAIDISESSVLQNPGSLDFSLNPSYTFVKTGLDSYDSALYLDGLAHDFTFNTPVYSLVRDTDFTVSYRWYQEQSTSSASNSFTIGGSNSLTFNGSKFTNFNGNSISVDIPYGSWNTVTIVRSGSHLLLFINGLLVSDAVYNTSSSDTLRFSLSADNNVKYLDELLYTIVPLYTATHVPRLQPYDSNKVLVVPENVSVDTIAVHGSIPINTYRIGGVRQVFPEYGDVYVYLEGNQVKSIQQYNGFGWVEVSGMVYFAGHWYSLETFRIGGMGNAFDGNISNPDPSGGSSGSGGSSSSGNALIDLGIKFLGLLETIANRIGDIAESIVNGVSGGFTTVTGLLERVIGTIADLITDLVGEFVDLIQQLFVGLANFFSSIFEGIGDFSEDVHSVGGLFSGIFGVLPSSFIRVFIFGIILLIAVSVFKLL